MEFLHKVEMTALVAFSLEKIVFDAQLLKYGGLDNINSKREAANSSVDKVEPTLMFSGLLPLIIMSDLQIA